MKRYITSQGEYLTILEQLEGFKIAWWIPRADRLGYILSHADFDSQDPDCALADEACLAYFVRRKWEAPLGEDFLFQTRRQASECLAQINRKLLARQASKPEWVPLALKAGWKPPKGWRP